MKVKEIIETLTGLIQLNVDAVHAYNQTLDDIDDEIIRKRLTDFRDDHQRHVEELSAQIQAQGGNPPELSQDFKGFVIEAFTALRSYTGGMKGALKALKTTEEITYKNYSAVVSKNFPSSLKEILRVQFSDEKIHLDYVKSNLEALP